MPVLSASQTLPAFTQSATLTAPARLSAAQVVLPLGQVASLGTPPARVLSASQVMEPFGQAARLVRAPFRGPATPRPERVPATPRP